MTVCQAHEQAFGYFRGIPEVVVYDQDRTLLVDENLGQLLLTSDFSQYVKAWGYKLYFCRKADPESKGKVLYSMSRRIFCITALTPIWKPSTMKLWPG